MERRLNNRSFGLLEVSGRLSEFVPYAETRDNVVTETASEDGSGFGPDRGF
jgi:hypothetical protein